MKNITELENLLQEDGIIFLTYGGLFTQSLIVGMTEALEKEAENSALSMKLANNIFIVFIELAQNLMSYSKSQKSSFDPKGLIMVGKDDNGYYVFSQNIVTKEDKDKIEERLKKVINATKEEIRENYKKARRSGKDMHKKGGGIGFLEIAKRAKLIKYEFVPLDEERYFFKIKVELDS